MPKVKLNNISIYYEAYGRGEPVLLIPGLNADNASWYDVYQKFMKHFRVIGIDNRASGRSDVPDKPYTIRDMADDAIGLLDHLKIKKCHVIGHSMGGYITQQMAIHYPARVGKIVLEATAAGSTARNKTLIRDLLEQFEKDNDNVRLSRSWSYWLFSQKTFERNNYIETYIKHASTYPYLQSAKGFRSQAEAIGRFNVRDGLKKIRARALVIAGSDDILIYPSQSKELARSIKGSVYDEIKGAGHCVHVEKPALFASKVIKFLKKKFVFIFLFMALGLLQVTDIHAKDSKVLADRIVDEESSRVEYFIRTTEGMDIAILVHYTNKRPDPEILEVFIQPPESVDKNGTTKFSVMSVERKPIDIEFMYKDGNLRGITVDTAIPETSKKKQRQILTVKSNSGYALEFGFAWQDGEPIAVMITPKINAYKDNMV